MPITELRVNHRRAGPLRATLAWFAFAGSNAPAADVLALVTARETRDQRLNPPGA